MTPNQDQPDFPQTIAFDEAQSCILSHAQNIQHPTQSRSIIVAITGPVGSGKSTLASRLPGLTLSTDRYLPDYHTITPAQRDLPEHADLPALALHLERLRSGQIIDAPIWSFHEHRRVATEILLPTPIIVCEGIHALNASLHHLIDIRVYIHASSATRWARWLAIEQSNQRGWGVENARQHFDTIAEPTFARYAPEYLSSAHLIVHNDHPPSHTPPPSPPVPPHPHSP